jgi:hypothetical protein
VATYNEVRAKIAASSREDWLKNHTGDELTYKGDLHIRIVSIPRTVFGSETEFDTELGTEFSEAWAQNIGVHAPERKVFTIYYSNSFVEDIHTVAVDGFRAFIPYPKSAEDLVISDWQYRFARLIQPPQNQLDEYLRRAGIRVR